MFEMDNHMYLKFTKPTTTFVLKYALKTSELE
jgi:hypothetical protein